MRYDIIIVGTGPAGLSAAITATIRNKKILLIGQKNLSEKVQKAHLIHNYPGLPASTGEDLVKAWRSHLKEMDIEITEGKVAMVMPMGDYFMLQTDLEENGGFIEATSVILSTGVVMAKPYPGEDELLGSGVSYCATCDAALYKGKTVAIIGGSPKEEPEADFMTEYAGKVYYFPLYEEDTNLVDSIEVRREKPLSIEGKMKVEKLVTDGGEYEVDGVFVLRESIAPGKLMPGLETEGPHIVVDRLMRTNVPGCFACGDITGKPYQYVKSAGEGNVAALSAVNYIDDLKRAKDAEEKAKGGE